MCACKSTPGVEVLPAKDCRDPANQRLSLLQFVYCHPSERSGFPFLSPQHFSQPVCSPSLSISSNTLPFGVINLHPLTAFKLLRPPSSLFFFVPYQSLIFCLFQYQQELCRSSNHPPSLLEEQNPEAFKDQSSTCSRGGFRSSILKSFRQS